MYYSQTDHVVCCHAVANVEQISILSYNFKINLGLRGWKDLPDRNIHNNRIKYIYNITIHTN